MEDNPILIIFLRLILQLQEHLLLIYRTLYGSGDGTDLYKVSRSSADTSSSLTVEFSAQDLQSLDDESWAIDNVRVYLYSR